MQRISIANLQPGMITARNVHNSDGSVLIKEDMPLSATYIKRLKQFGLGSIYIKNTLLEDIDVPELIKEETRVNAIQTVQFAFSQFTKLQDFDIGPIVALANSIVDEVILNREMMIHLVDTRTFDDYIYGHSVNVCILSVLVGLNMEYTEARLRELALGALLHDLGQTLVPAEIANKPSKLAPEEMDIVRQHTQAGFDVLRKIREVSTPAAHIAYQHHENYDGTGYPRKLKGDEIHEYARIVTITNIFDALISERPYRKAFPPHEAHEILMTLGQKFVDCKILNIFLSNIAIYPIGCVVQLSTGQIGVVTNVSRSLQARPQIKLIADENYNSLPVAGEVDLTRNLTVFITKLLKEQEIIELSNKINSTEPKNPSPAS